MARERKQQLALIVGFLAMIGMVGVVQAVVELKENEPVQVLDILKRTPNKTNLGLFEKELEDRSWFGKMVRPVMQYARVRILDDAGSKAIIGHQGWWFYRRGVQYLAESPPGNSSRDHENLEAVSAIVDFHRQLAEMGIRLLVVPIPGKASIYPDQLTNCAKGPLTHTPTDRLLTDLKQNGIEVVDVLEVFRQARQGAASDSDQQLYLPRDTHWTPTGCKLAARAVAGVIREMDILPPASTRWNTRTVIVSKRGDILSMLKSPWVEQMYTESKVRCEQVVSPSTGEPYQDDANSPVLVLGDSFLRVYERDEPGSAGFIAHLALELGRPVHSIVSDGGASTLVRQELAGKPEMLRAKTLVVWEFVERDVRFGMEGWQRIKLTRPAMADTQTSGRRMKATD